MKYVSGFFLALLVVVSVPVIVGFGVPLAFLFGAGFGLQRIGRKVSRVAAGLACRLDADCPPGHACVNGVCVPLN
ncbi:MAG: hypothetical protein HY673_19460 [Chloroflexi bacterium]|nr:hypothetical protein [Chloroflexota bacterium]